jgi:hypothetical protein
VAAVAQRKKRRTAGAYRRVAPLVAPAPEAVGRMFQIRHLPGARRAAGPWILGVDPWWRLMSATERSLSPGVSSRNLWLMLLCGFAPGAGGPGGGPSGRPSPGGSRPRSGEVGLAPPLAEEAERRRPSRDHEASERDRRHPDVRRPPSTVGPSEPLAAHQTAETGPSAKDTAWADRADDHCGRLPQGTSRAHTLGKHCDATRMSAERFRRAGQISASALTCVLPRCDPALTETAGFGSIHPHTRIPLNRKWCCIHARPVPECPQSTIDRGAARL